MLHVLRALAILVTTAAACAAADHPAWRKLPAIPDREGFAGSFAGVSGDMLLFAGGANIPGEKWGKEFVKVWYDTIWMLDRPDGAWRQVGRMPGRRGYGCSITLPEGLLCIGGSDSERHVDEVFVLSWEAGAVRRTAWPALPSPCAMMAAAQVGRAVYVAGGIDRPDATRPLDTLWMLDLDRVEAGWRQLPPCPGGPRMLAVAGGATDGFHLFSGSGLSPGDDGRPLRTFLRDAWRYRATTGWERLADLPRPTVAAPGPAAFVAGDILIESGDDGTHAGHEPIAEHPGFPHDTLRYHVGADRWSVEPGLPFGVVTGAVVPWRGMWVIPNGEVRPRVRSSDVWARTTAERPNAAASDDDPPSAEPNAFLGPPAFTMQPVFEGPAEAVRQVESLRMTASDKVREPYLAVTTDGTVLALRNYAGLLRRSVDGGRTFEPAVAVPFGVYDSSFIVDDTTGDVLVLRIWDSRDTVWRSRDQGRSWVEEPVTVRPNSVMRRLAEEGGVRGTRTPGDGRYFLHANASESGITLRRGPWKGRLIVAATFRPHAKEHPSDRTLADATCSCALFSDDRGRTWTVSEPFPEAYTEENALVELHDGRLYYNSRCCDGFFDKARERPLPPEASLRRTAWSDDGGATWRDLAINRVLPDGGGYGRGYGLKAGLVRLPLADRDVLLYSNTDTAGGPRERLTVWASFDGGRTWPVKRLVWAGQAAYSCLATVRPGTADAGRIYLLFEGADSGVYDAIQFAVFNLAWVVAGERTGDGNVPAWATAAGR